MVVAVSPLFLRPDVICAAATMRVTSHDLHPPSVALLSQLSEEGGLSLFILKWVDSIKSTD